MKKIRIRRLVLDVAKPLKEPSIISIAKALASLDGVEGVNITVVDVDVETMSLIITIEGEDINYDEVVRILSENGAAVHSVDQVIVGEKIVEYVRTPVSKG